MIERGKYGIEVSCDGCSEAFEVESRDWSDAVEELRERKWRFRKDEADEWEHHCPACVEAEAEKGTQDGGGMPDELW